MRSWYHTVDWQKKLWGSLRRGRRLASLAREDGLFWRLTDGYTQLIAQNRGSMASNIL